jgi:hypothetical protein
VYTIQKSGLFTRQLRFFTHEYTQNVDAGKVIALRFVDAVEEATRFIQSNSLACAIYTESRQHPKLMRREYRKWRVKGFPHVVFFHMEEEVITIAGLYAQKMHIAVRFPSDTDT